LLCAVKQRFLGTKKLGIQKERAPRCRYVYQGGQGHNRKFDRMAAGQTGADKRCMMYDVCSHPDVCSITSFGTWETQIRSAMNCWSMVQRVG
jgi:hypothetical protein